MTIRGYHAVSNNETIIYRMLNDYIYIIRGVLMMRTNLQFFADPNPEPKPNDSNPNPDGKNPKQAGKTYTQDDIGKMMASKAKEVESNLRDDFEKGA